MLVRRSIVAIPVFSPSPFSTSAWGLSFGFSGGGKRSVYRFVAWDDGVWYSAQKAACMAHPLQFGHRKKTKIGKYWVHAYGAVTLADDAAVPLLLERLDGAGPTTAEVALGKARTAALTRQPTKLWEERVKERPAFLNFPAGLAIWGGVPIIYQGECVGAIGVSGVQSQDDEKIASAGVAALTG